MAPPEPPLEPVFRVNVPNDDIRHRTAASLVPLVYDDLRVLATAYLTRERPDHTLSPTELVHEAFGRLSEDQSRRFNSRTHFMAVAAIAMRHVLVDHARARRAQKRGGGQRLITLPDDLALKSEHVDEVIDVHHALTRLTERDAPAAQVAEMVIFGGMNQLEIAEAMGYSDRWVREQWKFARAWIRSWIDRESARAEEDEPRSP